MQANFAVLTYLINSAVRHDILPNPLYTGRLFHCDMLDESVCHFRGVGFKCRVLANTVDPYQMPLTLLRFLGLKWVNMCLLPFQNNSRNLVLSYKINLDLWIVLEGNRLHFITEKIWYCLMQQR